MPFIDPSEDFHHYAGAEAFVGDIKMGNGTTTRYVRLRIHTTLMTADSHTPSSTQWIYIPADDVDQLSTQLAAVSESAKRWVAGETFEVVGENLGVMNTTGKHD